MRRKILGISASPRRGGNTETLLDRALEGARKRGAAVEKVVLNELCIKPCRGCGACFKTGACVIKDDMRLIYKKVDSCDALIIASPIYFGSVSAQLKTMIDRFQPYWIRKYILKRPVSKKSGRRGVFLCAAASDRKSFFRNAGSIVKNFFATLDVKYYGGVFCGCVEKPQDVLVKKLKLKKSFDLGARLVKYKIVSFSI